MFTLAFFSLLGVGAALATAAAFRDIARDGYGRRPTLGSRIPRV